jgi:hypothetical protein
MRRKEQVRGLPKVWKCLHISVEQEKTLYTKQQHISIVLRRKIIRPFQKFVTSSSSSLSVSPSSTIFQVLTDLLFLFYNSHHFWSTACIPPHWIINENFDQVWSRTCGHAGSHSGHLLPRPLQFCVICQHLPCSMQTHEE